MNTTAVFGIKCLLLSHCQRPHYKYLYLTSRKSRKNLQFTTNDLLCINKLFIPSSAFVKFSLTPQPKIASSTNSFSYLWSTLGTLSYRSWIITLPYPCVSFLPSEIFSSSDTWSCDISSSWQYASRCDI